MATITSPYNYTITEEQFEHLGDTRQTELWAVLIICLIINDVTIVGRVWGTWRAGSGKMRVLVEDIGIVVSGVFVNAIIANLMVATHYGLGRHFYAVNWYDADWPQDMSHTFRHVWITMVLMAAFFAAIKITLLYFYKRLFLVSNNWLLIFWWINLVWVVLWFFGATGFYLLQCQPVSWYFMQYYKRYGKPVPGGMTGQCNATTVQHVAMPIIFNLVSDIGLMVLPVFAIWNLQLNKWKKVGLIAVFGIGLTACALEIARICALLINTDDKNDPSWGVAIFLIYTACEETAAVVCACLPVIGPQLYNLVRKNKSTNRSGSYPKYGSKGEQYTIGGSAMGGGVGSRQRSGFQRFDSENQLTGTGEDLSDDIDGGDHLAHSTKKLDGRADDLIHLTTVNVSSGHHSHSDSGSADDERGMSRGEAGGHGGGQSGAWPLAPAGIYVRTDVQVTCSDTENGQLRR